MSEKAMSELRETLCMELEEISEKRELSMGDLETVHKLTDTIKNIDKIGMMGEGGSSYYGDSYGDSYGDWRASGTYDRGRMSRGRYSRDGMDGSSYRNRHYVRGHYSYADEDRMLEDKIQEMMDSNKLTLDDKSTLKKALEAIRR